MALVFTLSLSRFIPLSVLFSLSLLTSSFSKWRALGWQQVKTVTQQVCTQNKMYKHEMPCVRMAPTRVLDQELVFLDCLTL